ncbi:hypothetical protein ACIBL8_44160 [Streptomyces sp. NPDC050523]|uniref:hypothetical protein n=1 Tax=Streptomyces sp. NPDC050523 TaxID=3365622 RepID=UPI00379D9435
MPSSFTGAEKRRMAWLILKAGKQSMAGDRDVDTIDPRVKAEMERIEARGEARGEAEVAALRSRLQQARTAAANAKATMRAASGKDRAEARRQMHDHERAARRIEADLRRYR